MKRDIIWLCLAVILGCTGCGARYERRCSKWLPWIYQDTPETDRKFASYDLPTQYEIYFCGMNYVRPPLIHLAFKVARNGRPVVGFLRTTMETAKDDFEIVYVIEVFEAMQHLHSYDVAADKDLMKSLQKNTARVRDEHWRQRAIKDVKHIQTGKSE